MPPVYTTAPPEAMRAVLESAGWSVIADIADVSRHWVLEREGNYVIVPKGGALLDWDAQSACLEQARMTPREYKDRLRELGYSSMLH